MSMAIEQNPTIPATIPVTGQDLFNYLAVYAASNHQIHMVLHIEGQINQEVLARAIRVTMDLEPVLGCRFVEHEHTAYFQRRSDLDSLELCPVIMTEYTDEELRKFVAQASDAREDLLVQTRVFRSATRDVICIKLDHTCADGGGLKEYTYLLAKVYNHLIAAQDYPKRSLLPVRDCNAYFQSLGISDPRQAWDPSRTAPAPSWGFPCHSHQNQVVTHSSRRFSAEQLMAMAHYAKQRGATINDLLITAWYRAFFTLTNAPEREAKPLLVSADLRRYLPETHRAAVANLSSSFSAQLTMVRDEGFSSTLQRVKQMMANYKQDQAELPVAIIFELLGMMGFTGAKDWFEGAYQQAMTTACSDPLLSNIGIIQQMTLGKHCVQDAYIITPAMFAPGCMLGASTYNHVLTLVMSYFASDVAESDVERFLDLMADQLNRL